MIVRISTPLICAFVIIPCLAFSASGTTLVCGMPFAAVTTLADVIASGGCIIGNSTFSSFSFTEIQGDAVMTPPKIAVMASPLSANGISFASTPLTFSPSGTVEVEIGFTVDATSGNEIDAINATAGPGSSGDTSRAPVINYACIDSSALVNPGGSVACSSGSPFLFSTTFSSSSSLQVPPASKVAIVADLLVENTGSAFGDLDYLSFQFGEVPHVTPEPGTDALLTAGLLLLVSLRKDLAAPRGCGDARKAVKWLTTAKFEFPGEDGQMKMGSSR